MWYLETSVVTEFSFQLHLFAVELLDIQCDTVLYFGICILQCLSDLSLSTCEIQLFHSSTGLIVLSARPAHPICGGGTLLFALVCLAVGICIFGICHWMAIFIQCVDVIFSLHSDVTYSLATSVLRHCCNAHLTIGGLFSLKCGHKDVFKD